VALLVASRYVLPGYSDRRVWVQDPGLPDHLCRVIVAYALRLNSWAGTEGLIVPQHWYVKGQVPPRNRQKDVKVEICNSYICRLCTVLIRDIKILRQKMPNSACVICKFCAPFLRIFCATFQPVFSMVHLYMTPVYYPEYHGLLVHLS